MEPYSQSYELYEGDSVVHYTLLEIEHDHLQMKAVVWVISFPNLSPLVLTDILN